MHLVKQWAFRGARACFLFPRRKDLELQNADLWALTSQGQVAWLPVRFSRAASPRCQSSTGICSRKPGLWLGLIEGAHFSVASHPTERKKLAFVRLFLSQPLSLARLTDFAE